MFVILRKKAMKIAPSWCETFMAQLFTGKPGLNPQLLVKVVVKLSQNTFVLVKFCKRTPKRSICLRWN